MAYRMTQQPMPISGRQMGSTLAAAQPAQLAPARVPQREAPGRAPVVPIRLAPGTALRPTLAPASVPIINPSIPVRPQPISLPPGRYVPDAFPARFAPGTGIPVTPSNIPAIPVRPVFPSPAVPARFAPGTGIPVTPSNIPAIPVRPVFPSPAVPVTPVFPAPAAPILPPTRDSHGCLLSAGYSWCPLTQSCVQDSETPCVLGPGGKPKYNVGLEPPMPIFPNNPEAPLAPGGAQICDFSAPFFCTASQQNAFTAAEAYGLSGLAGACVLPAAPYGEDRCSVTTAGHCAATSNGTFYPGQMVCPTNTAFHPTPSDNILDHWISPEGNASVTHLLGRSK